MFIKGSWIGEIIESIRYILKYSFRNEKTQALSRLKRYKNKLKIRKSDSLIHEYHSCAIVMQLHSLPLHNQYFNNVVTI